MIINKVLESTTNSICSVNGDFRVDQSNYTYIELPVLYFSIHLLGLIILWYPSLLFMTMYNLYV